MTDDEFAAEELRYEAQQRESMVRAASAGPYPMRVIARASLMAKDAAAENGFLAALDKRKRQWVFDPDDTPRMLLHTRQDAAAAIIVAHEVLKNQQTIKRLLWAITFLVIYILAKLS